MKFFRDMRCLVALLSAFALLTAGCGTMLTKEERSEITAALSRRGGPGNTVSDGSAGVGGTQTDLGPGSRRGGRRWWRVVGRRRGRRRWRRCGRGAGPGVVRRCHEGNGYRRVGRRRQSRDAGRHQRRSTGSLRIRPPSCAGRDVVHQQPGWDLRTSDRAPPPRQQDRCRRQSRRHARGVPERVRRRRLDVGFRRGKRVARTRVRHPGHDGRHHEQAEVRRSQHVPDVPERRSHHRAVCAGVLRRSATLPRSRSRRSCG